MAKTIAQLTAELDELQRKFAIEIATYSEATAQLQELQGKFDAEVAAHAALKVQFDLLKAENDTLKVSVPAPAPIFQDSKTLEDGRKVKVHFGVNIPELGKEYSREEILENEEVISYLLEIGSGAVSIVDADTTQEG